MEKFVLIRSRGKFILFHNSNFLFSFPKTNFDEETWLPLLQKGDFKKIFQSLVPSLDLDK